MIARLARLLQLEPDEARSALGLGAVLFALTASYTLVKTARDALFLAHLPAQLLPYIYLGVGILTTIAAIGYTWLVRGRTALQALEWATWGSAALLGVFAWLFRTGAHSVAVAFYLWVNVYGLILLSQFWLSANAASDPREAKRTFGMIGTGGILGGLAGGLSAPLLVRLGELPALVTAGALLLVLAAPAIRLSFAGAGLVAVEDSPTGDEVQPFKSRYVRWLAIASLCSVLVTTLLDYQFKVEIQRRDPSPAGIASFLGLFYTATNLAAILLQVFATRWALGRLGATWSAALLPAGLGIGAVATVLVPGFVTVISSRLWDQVLRISLNKTATELFFFPLTPALRRRAKAWIEAGIERLGDAVAGVVILLAGLAMGATTHTIAFVVLGLVLAWVVAWVGVRHGYRRELGRNLQRMNLDPRAATISLHESRLLTEMGKLLDSPFERIVLHGIDLLEEAAPERLRAELGRLLAHPAAAVRVRALHALSTERDPELESQVEALLRDPYPEVRIAALRARCLVVGAASLDTLEEYLSSDDPHLRRSALECMVEVATPLEENRVRAVLDRTLRDGDGGDRLAIAKALGRRKDSALHELLPGLAKDAVLEVRNAALVSGGHAGRRTMVPRMIDALGTRSTRAAGRAALVAFGDRVAGTLGDYLADTSIDLDVRRELPRALAAIGSPEAVNALLRARDRSDVRLSYRILKAMNQIRARNPRARFPRDIVAADIEYDVRSHLFAFIHYRSCPIGRGRSAERLLCIALNERMDQALNRIFRRLALLYPEAEAHAAYRGIVSEDPRKRGNALEYIENALAPEHAALVLPLVDDSGDEGKLRFAEQRFGMLFTTPVQSLQEILDGDDAWLRTCALYVVGSQREHSLRDRVERQLLAREPHVRETALWAQTALGTA